MKLLIADAVSYSYPDHPREILQGLSFQLEPGQLVRLSGRNGSGKTTALRLLAGELKPTSGRVVQAPGTRTLYLDQKAASIMAPNLTVTEHLRAFRRGDCGTDLLTQMAAFGLPLESLLPKFAGQLSGGERQLFALLCALGGRYDIVLLDEFTSHLDEKSETVAYDLLSNALRLKLIGVVLVSHRPLPFEPDQVTGL